MERTQIYIDSLQRKLLKEIAAKQGFTLSGLIREALWSLVAKYQKPKKTPLQGIIALYSRPEDAEGSTRHDDIYE